MDGYIRVSRRMGREGPGYISPDVQRESIQRWADYRGVEIAAWHVDEDESGGTQNRPGLRAAMERIEARETEGLAVWKIDRFARNVHEAIRDIKSMQERSGSPALFASVTEDIDPTGPFGDFILTVMLAVATLQRDSLVEGWKTAKSRAMDRGVKIGPTPFGYRRRNDATLEPHPKHGPMVAEAFRRAAAGSVQDAVEYLDALGVVHDEGARAGRTRTWTTSTTRRLLRNRVYLGENRYGDRVEHGAHEALVSRSAWEAAQPGEVVKRRRAAAYPLSGLARCGSCGERMVGGTSGGKVRTYRCRASLALWKGERCTAPANIVADRLEEYVRGELEAVLERRWEGAGDPAGDLVDAERALHEAESELDSIVQDASLRRAMGDERFRIFVEANVAAVEEAQATYRDAASRAAQGVSVIEAGVVAEASLSELGELARGGLDAIVVRRGREALDTRVSFVVGDPPAEVGATAPEDAQHGGVKA